MYKFKNQAHMYSLIGSYITMRHTTWNTSSDLCAISYGGIYPRRIRVCIYIFFLHLWVLSRCLLLRHPKWKKIHLIYTIPPHFPYNSHRHHRFTKKRKIEGVHFTGKMRRKFHIPLGTDVYTFFLIFLPRKDG